MIDENKIKPCPFCGGDKIDYSVKTTGRRERKYHVAMYCKKCNCYGARTLITPTEECRWDVEKNEEYKKLAIEAWNDRTEQPQGIDKDRLIRAVKETFDKWHVTWTSPFGKAIKSVIIQQFNQQPTSDGWIPCKIYHRLTKESDDTTHANKICCTHFNSEECQQLAGNCSAGCFWEEYVWERLAHFEDLAEQGRLAYLPQPYKEGEKHE